MQAVSETLTHKVMREARAQQEELDAEDRPAGNVLQVQFAGVLLVFMLTLQALVQFLALAS